MPSAEDSTIVSAEVSKDDIIEFFPERNEAEVVILPSAVKSVKVDTLYGLESVEEEILEIMPRTKPAAKRFGICMQFMANSMQMSPGTMPYTLRVLFNALLLVEMDGIMLSEEETQMLMDAVIYHDIGRTNDDVDDSHGKASRDIYAADRKPENPGTGFLIEYHCLDDAVARRDLEALSLPNVDRIWLLYTILKDADALDRVRFGLRHLNPKYLRNDTAHKILPVAQLCLEHLTF